MLFRSSFSDARNHGKISRYRRQGLICDTGPDRNREGTGQELERTGTGIRKEMERRILLRVNYDEEMESELDLTFTTLMGDKVEPRREFIEENAKFVKDIDIF